MNLIPIASRMASVVLLAVLIVPAVLIAPLATADDIDNKFLAALDSQGIAYDAAASAITAGHAVCAEIDGGKTPTQVAQEIQTNTNLDGFHSGYFVGAAIGSYCPQHSSG